MFNGEVDALKSMNKTTYNNILAIHSLIMLESSYSPSQNRLQTKSIMKWTKKTRI